MPTTPTRLAIYTSHLVGIDLLAWTRTLLLGGEHALAEPKKLRYLESIGACPRRP